MQTFIFYFVDEEMIPTFWAVVITKVGHILPLQRGWGLGLLSLKRGRMSGHWVHLSLTNG